MAKLKIHIRNIACNVLHRAAVLDIVKKRCRDGQSFILMYHRVLAEETIKAGLVQPGMFVSAGTFRRHLALLQSKFTIFKLSELVERASTGRELRGTCAITFDDGWRDNFSTAFPILKEFSAPATIFLATGYIGTHNLLWPDELLGRLQSLIQENKRLPPEVRSLLPTKKMKPDQFETIVSTFKKLDSRRRRALIDTLSEGISTGPPGRKLMDWSEATAMKSCDLIEFGAHTVNHEILDRLQEAEAEQEILLSQRHIIENLGVYPMLFAYPNGNSSPSLEAMVRNAGFKGAVTTRKGWFGEKTSAFRLPRIGMHEDVCRTSATFYGRIVLERL